MPSPTGRPDLSSRCAIFFAEFVVPIYLDNAATTPLAPKVRDELIRAYDEDYGNAASRTHEFGQRAKQAVQRARTAIAQVVDADPADVFFTSGATEANNIAILGLADHGSRLGRRHLVTSSIEHKAVMEPIEALEARGFEVTRVPVDGSGRLSAEAVTDAVRPDTLLVSVMHANNETGMLQPIGEIADGLQDAPAYFHVDSAQGFGKELEPLRHKRIDLISISAHKIFGPKGVGALIGRRRGYDRIPLTPLVFGGGQERGVRPGTAPVPLISAFGVAASLAEAEFETRRKVCEAIRENALSAFATLDAEIIGVGAAGLPHILNIAFRGVDSEALMLSLKDLIAISNGSACTSASYEPSHVLAAMGLPSETIASAVRLSWSHLTPPVPWDEVAARISDLQHGY